jgi:hypothetical protein
VGISHSTTRGNAIKSPHVSALRLRAKTGEPIASKECGSTLAPSRFPIGARVKLLMDGEEHTLTVVDVIQV